MVWTVDCVLIREVSFIQSVLYREVQLYLLLISVQRLMHQTGLTANLIDQVLKAIHGCVFYTQCVRMTEFSN